MLTGGGLKPEAIENFDPAHGHAILPDGPKKKAPLENVKTIVRKVGAADIPIRGGNFSSAGVCGRTHQPCARGGAMSVGLARAMGCLPAALPGFEMTLGSGTGCRLAAAQLDPAAGTPVSDPACMKNCPATRRIGDRRSALPTGAGAGSRCTRLAAAANIGLANFNSIFNNAFMAKILSAGRWRRAGRPRIICPRRRRVFAARPFPDLCLPR